MNRSKLPTLKSLTTRLCMPLFVPLFMAGMLPCSAVAQDTVLNFTFDDLLVTVNGQSIEAASVSSPCTRACDCPEPFPCNGPCPDFACDPPCERLIAAALPEGQVVRTDPLLSGAEFKLGFDQFSGASVNLRLSPLSPQSVNVYSAVLEIMDSNGDFLSIGAQGIWYPGNTVSFFDGTIVKGEFEDSGDAEGTFDGTFDGSGDGTIPLTRIGCGVSGVLQVAVSASRGSCTVGTILGVVTRSVDTCPADLDCSGEVNQADADSFAELWNSGNMDFNGDRATDGDDVIDFFDRWVNGC